MTLRIAQPLALAAFAMGLAGVGPAFAAMDAPIVTAPVATAPVVAALAVTAPLASAPGAQSVADQIATYLRDSPAARLPAEDTPEGVTSSAPKRQPHGVVDVAVGSHGYRSVYVRSDLPIGATGTLSIAVGQTRGGPGLYSGYGPDFGEPGVGSPDFGASGLGAGGLNPRRTDCRRRVGSDRPCRSGSPLAAPLNASDDRDGGRIDPSH